MGLKSKKIWVKCGFIVLLCALIMFCVFKIYYAHLNKALTQDVVTYLSELSVQETKTVQSKIEGDFGTLRSMAFMIGAKNIDFDNIIPTLEKVRKENGYKRMGVITPKGLAYATDDVPMDASQRAYFKNAMAGQTIISQTISDLVDGESINVYSTPIYQNGKVAGVLFAALSNHVFSQMLCVDSFDGAGYSYVAGRDGQLVFQTGDQVSTDNLFPILESQDVSQGEMRNSILHRSQKGTVEYYQDEWNFASYSPLGYNDWYLFSVVPKSVIEQRIHNIHDLTKGLLIGVSGVFAILLIFVLLLQRKVQDQVKRAKLEIETIASNIPGGVQRCKYDDFCTLTYMSDGFLKMVGYTKEEILTLFDNQYVNMVHKDDLKLFYEKFQEQMSQDKKFELEYRIRKKEGGYLWVLDKGSLVNEGSQGEYIYCILLDITEEKRVRQEVAINNERYRILTEQSDDIVFEVFIEEETLFYTHNFEEKLGYRPDISNFPQSVIKSKMFYREDVPTFIKFYRAFQKEKRKYQETEVRLLDASGKKIWFLINATAVFDEDANIVKVIGKLKDIDEQKRKMQALERKAHSDSLSGLYNKLTMQKMIESYIGDEGKQKTHALLVIDIDNFKAINDTMGHLFGDAVISGAASKMSALFRASDILGRIGGDEFMVLLKNVPNREMVWRKAEAIVELFGNMYRDTDKKSVVSCSVGIALYDSDANDYNGLYRAADIALYSAKEHGKGKAMFYSDVQRVQQDVAFPLELTPPSWHIATEENRRATAVNIHPTENFSEYIFKMLFESKDISGSIQLILDMVGQHFQVSRAYVFENSQDNLHCVNTFEWCNAGVASQKHNLTQIPYATLGNYQENFDEEGIFYCSDIKTLNQRVYEILEAQGIQSVLQCAILDDGEFCGYIGFDECDAERMWTKNEIETLSFVAKFLGVFLVKSNAAKRVKQSYHRFQDMVNNMDVYIYVVDRQNYEVNYLNQKIKDLAPEVKEGDICYRAFFERDDVCEQCPIMEYEKMGAGKAMEVYNQKFNKWVISAATPMEWSKMGQQYLVFCHDVTQYKND